ncbi:hypothetical protein [Streptomyces sp. NPDC055005]
MQGMQGMQRRQGVERPATHPYARTSTCTPNSPGPDPDEPHSQATGNTRADLPPRHATPSRNPTVPSPHRDPAVRPAVRPATRPAA